MKPLLTELQRRRVPQVLGVYMAAAFAISQAIQVLQDAVALPGWVLTAFVITALAGFPVVALVAWLYDFQGAGVTRTESVPRSQFHWSATHVSIALIVFIALMFGGWLALAPRTDDTGRVAVLPLQDKTGDPALHSLGEVAADWITESLVRAAFVDVVDVQATLQAGIAPTKSSLPTAHTFVSGSYYRVGEKLIFNVRITSPDGRTLQALQPIEGPAAEPTKGLNELRDRVVAALAIALDKKVSDFEGQGASAPSYRAYESYVEGLHAYLQGNFRDAALKFMQAYQGDTTFLRAKLWAAASQGFINIHEVARTQAMFREIAARDSELSTYDRHHLSFFIAVFQRDNERAYAEARAMVKAAPGSDDAVRELALSALRTGRLREAVELFTRLERATSITREWDEFYFALTNAHLGLGQVADALEVARRGRTQARTGFTLGALGVASAANGEIARAVALADTLLQEDVRDGPRNAMHIATALNAAGERDQAVRIWRAGSAHPLANREWRARALIYAGDLSRAAVLADSTAQRFTTVRFRLHGLISAQRGDTAGARAALDSLARQNALYRTGDFRAHIFAQLGQKDSAVAALGTVWFEQDTPSSIHPMLLPLRGYPPFDRAVKGR